MILYLQCKCVDPDNQDKSTGPQCGLLQYKGDGVCDDENNNKGCAYDGGDCCAKTTTATGGTVNKSFCNEVSCGVLWFSLFVVVWLPIGIPMFTTVSWCACILTVYGFIVSSASALTRRAHRSQQRKCKRQFVAWTAKRRKINALQNVSKYKSNTQESANWPWTVSKLRMVEINWDSVGNAVVYYHLLVQHIDLFEWSYQ